MKQPIKIYQNYRQQTIDILVYTNDTCNYACYYCYNDTPRTLQKNSLMNVYNFLCNILRKTNKNIYVELIGGEPTLHHELVDFIKILSCNSRIKCGIYTNFTADINLYNFCLKNNVVLTITLHHQFDFATFLNKLLMIEKYIKKHLIDIKVMLEHLHFDECLKNYHILYETYGNNVEACLLDHDLKTYSIYHSRVASISQYTKQQIETFNNISLNYNKIYTVIYSDNSSKNISIADATNNKEFNNFKFWKCNAGKEFFYINYDGNIYPCQAFLNKSPLGNINNFASFEKMQLKYTICPVDDCYCLWEVKKEKIFKHI